MAIKFTQINVQQQYWDTKKQLPVMCIQRSHQIVITRRLTSKRDIKCIWSLEKISVSNHAYLVVFLLIKTNVVFVIAFPPRKRVQATFLRYEAGRKGNINKSNYSYPCFTWLILICIIVCILSVWTSGLQASLSDEVSEYVITNKSRMQFFPVSEDILRINQKEQ